MSGVCHGPNAFANAKSLATGEAIIKGRKVIVGGMPHVLTTSAATCRQHTHTACIPPTAFLMSNYDR